MRLTARIILIMMLCGILAARCGGDVDEDLSPVHVRVYNTDTEDFVVIIGTQDYGKVLQGTKTDYKEFAPLSSNKITITGSIATTTLNTGSGGIFTLTIDDKDDIKNWKVKAD